MTSHRPAGRSQSPLPDTIDHSLARARLRRTPVRALVLEALHRAPGHSQCRRDIALWVLSRPSPPSSSAVYNAILDLERHGLLGRTWTREGKSVYWLNQPSRPAPLQMVCRHCDRCYPLDDAELLAHLQRLGEAHGVAISQPTQSIEVVCAHCRAEMPHATRLPGPHAGATH